MKRIICILLAVPILLTFSIVAACKKKESQQKPAVNLQAAIETAAKQKTPEAYLNLSLALYQSGQLEKSIEAAQEALKLTPDYAPAYNNICAANNELRMWDKGIEACQQALRIDPGYQLAKNNLNWAISAKANKK